jgi:hypothetical protein
VCLGFYLLMAFVEVEEWAPQERGRTSMCLVEKEEKVVSYNSGGSPPDAGTISVDYHYRLRCPEGRPRSMVTGSSVPSESLFAGGRRSCRRSGPWGISYAPRPTDAPVPPVANDKDRSADVAFDRPDECQVWEPSHAM